MVLLSWFRTLCCCSLLSHLWSKRRGALPRSTYLLTQMVLTSYSCRFRVLMRIVSLSANVQGVRVRYYYFTAVK